MKRRNFYALALSAMMMIAMTGCGGDNDTAGAKTQATEEAAETKIQLTGRYADKPTEEMTEEKTEPETAPAMTENDADDFIDEVHKKMEEIENGDFYNINNERVSLN